MLNKNEILAKVSKALDYQFESYSWLNIIDDTDLTKEEKDWAKENISYKAYMEE